MILIKIIITSVLFCFWFIHQAKLPEKLKINYKPFNCEVCLPIYISALFYLCNEWTLNLILVCIVSAVISPFIKNFLINLYFK